MGETAMTENEKTTADWILESRNNEYSEKNGQTQEQYHQKQADITKQLASPCKENTDSSFRVGNWSSTNTSAFRRTQEITIPGADGKDISLTSVLPDGITHRLDQMETQDMPEKPSANDYKTVFKELPPEKQNSGGYYDVQTDTITLREYTAEEKRQAQELRKQFDKPIREIEVIAGNPEYTKRREDHEASHRYDYKCCGIGKLSTSPTNAARGDRLTETKAYAVEYLSAAQEYMTLKQQGQLTYQADGQEFPIESIIEGYTGLKEVIDTKGFDITDKQSVRNVVEVASKSWEAEHQENYMKQHLAQAAYASSTFAQYPISEQLDLLKNEEQTYTEVSEKMLKNTVVGRDTVIDLSDCRELLDTLDPNSFKENIRQAQQKGETNDKIDKINLISYKELSEINTYLEDKGVIKDAEKADYLNKHITATATRSENNDPELEGIMNKYNKVKTYADGLQEIGNLQNYGIIEIRDKNGNTYSMADTQLAQAKEQIKQEEENKKAQETLLASNDTNKPMPTISLDGSDKMPEITLTSSNDNTKEEMQQQRIEHDKEVTTKIAELTDNKMPVIDLPKEMHTDETAMKDELAKQTAELTQPKTEEKTITETKEKEENKEQLVAQAPTNNNKKEINPLLLKQMQQKSYA